MGRRSGPTGTRGTGLKAPGRLLALSAELHGPGTLRTLRDGALLRLLAENALLRAEVCALDVDDFSRTGLRPGARRKKARMAKTPVMLDLTGREALDAVADEMGQSRSALIREAVRRVAEEAPTRVRAQTWPARAGPVQQQEPFWVR